VAKSFNLSLFSALRGIIYDWIGTIAVAEKELMLVYLAKKIFGTRNDRILKTLRPVVMRINDLERHFQPMSDAELSAQTALFKQRLANGESLDSLLPEAFAVVREAGRRVVGMRHFDVQLIGGAILHHRMISEMRTGEGKTLVATLPAYLNALTGRGVHVVTVNDYLARRDAEWMGRIHRFLGLSVGCVYHGISEQARRDAYQADITYGQNNEFGFDFLRDNMKFSAGEMVQRGHYFAIVDEVDSILIDEARTPLIISGPAEESTDKYLKINQIVPRLEKGPDFEMEVKTKQPNLTDEGIKKVEQLLGIDNLYDPSNIELLHHVNQGLRAHHSFERDVDYVVQQGQVVIVDEFTGRLMPGRRWSNGLHQAIEAKEGVQVARENQTLASITFQNYFRMYEKLAGMTGTADTEASEFKEIYGLEVALVPTNRNMIRVDSVDLVYRTRREKYAAVAEEIIEANKLGQPILVGTISIDQSEHLSRVLKERGVAHNVLNAKHHEREAEIIAQAGRFGAVTISTNMAGRGTDILLGGNPEFLAAAEAGTRDPSAPEYQAALEKFKAECAAERERVVAAGGLFVLGTERHESRRIDNQLRGRAGRQGDPGASRFYVSLEDDLMIRFQGERLQQLMARMGWEEGMALDNSLMSRTIETAQKRVEAMHFESRKHVTQYDDVMNKQRQVIYNQRARILRNESIREEILDTLDDLLESTVTAICDERIKPVEWDLPKIVERFTFLTGREFSFPENLVLDHQSVFDALREKAHSIYAEHASAQSAKLAGLNEIGVSPQLNRGAVAVEGPVGFEVIEQDTMLEALDYFWRHHLQEMDYLREGIGLRGYAQKNPLYEYQREGFVLFQQMLEEMKESIVRRLFFYVVPAVNEVLAHFEEERKRHQEREQQMRLTHGGQTESPPSDGDDSDKTGSRTPEQERARLEAQRKARRASQKR
jgi:preprotein translocase subunit SecA